VMSPKHVSETPATSDLMLRITHWAADEVTIWDSLFFVHERVNVVSRTVAV